jgi:hypothetical protein
VVSFDAEFTLSIVRFIAKGRKNKVRAMASKNQDAIAPSKSTPLPPFSLLRIGKGEKNLFAAILSATALKIAAVFLLP